MLGTPTQCHTAVIYGDVGQKARFHHFHSVDNNKHHYRNFNSFLKRFGGLLDRIQRQLRLEPKTLTPAPAPAGVRSSTLAP